MTNFSAIKNIHFIGIGGTGMNGLAQLAIHNNFNVSGSDRKYNPSLSPYKELEKLGIKIFFDDGSYETSKNTLVVFSSAIELNNKDLIKADKNNLKKLHRIDFLKELIPKDAEIIAITGTAGKTTTTGLLSWIFENHNLNPSVYCGAGILNWKKNGNLGNIKFGNSKLWIIESDESDKSLLKINPTHSIITNIGNDHLSKKELKKVFKKFGQKKKKIHQKKIDSESKKINFNTNLIGEHNQDNIRTAYSFCKKYGLNIKKTRKTIESFKGIERRLELVNIKDSIYFFDDYAHNPMKIKSTLDSLTKIPKINNVHAFWRPHGHKSFNQGYDELNSIVSNFLKLNKGSFTIMPIFYDGGTIKVHRTSEDFYKNMKKKYQNIYYVQNYDNLMELYFQIIDKNDAFVGMGARDPNISLFIKDLINHAV